MTCKYGYFLYTIVNGANAGGTTCVSCRYSGCKISLTTGATTCTGCGTDCTS